MDVILIARCFVCLFFAVLFLQSGLDKFVDWTGNLSYLDEHFEKTLLHRAAIPLLMMLTLMELGTGTMCVGGLIATLGHVGDTIPIAAMSLVCLTLTSLFATQRFVKDYPGAVTITTYFGVALFGLLLMWPILPELAREIQEAAQQAAQ